MSTIKSPSREPKGHTVASWGVVTDEAIIEYIRTQDVTKEDGDFRVDGE